MISATAGVPEPYWDPTPALFFPDELEILMLACAPTLEPSGEQRLAFLLGNGPDFQALLELMRKHRIFPVASPRLRALGEHLPSDFAKSLDQMESMVARWNMNLLQSQIRLQEAFDQAGIPLLPFKGLTLAFQLYGNLAGRQTTDLDILIKPEHAERAEIVLHELGFNRDYAYLPEHIPLRRAVAAVDQMPYLGAGDTLVELHWRLDQHKHLWPAEHYRFWNKLNRISLGRAAFPVLPEPELLLYLCVHGSKHAWERLQWVLDIALLSVSLDEEGRTRLCKLAEEEGLIRPLALGLWWANLCFRAPFFDEIHRQVQGDRVFERLCRHVRAGFCAPEHLQGREPAPHFRAVLANHRFWMDLKPTFRYKAEVVKVALQPKSTEMAGSRSGSYLGFTVKRIGRLLRKYMGKGS